MVDHRAFIAGVSVSWLACLLSAGATAQAFQFTTSATRAPVSVLPLGWSVGGYAAGDDFDGDGDCDLITMSLGAKIFLGSPTGFVAGTSMTATNQRIELVDFEGDGDRDFAFVPARPFVPNYVLMYENTPAGPVYVSLPSALNGVQAFAVAVGDVDGDGRADMVVAMPNGSTAPALRLARRTATRSFVFDPAGIPAGLPLALWPELCDIDGDGDLDLLATNMNSGLRLLRNVGGSFVDATASLPPTRTGHVYLRRADFDGDGRDDCAAALLTGAVDMLWGAAGGPTFATNVVQVTALELLWPADFDGDGDGDMLADGTNGLEVLWNQGGRQFTRAVFDSGDVVMRGIGDFDRDGRDDVVFAIWPLPSIVRLRYAAQLEDASFGALSLNSSSVISAPLAGDVDGDGRTDVVSLDQVSLNNYLIVDRSLGGGIYQRQSALIQGLTNHPVRMHLGDMDGDGDLDIVLKDDARVAMLTNNGAGAFAFAQLTASTSIGSDDLRLADLDGDGDLDIAFADDGGAKLSRNLGGGVFAPPVVIAPPGTYPFLGVADVDGDGDLDVMTHGLHSIVVNDGTGTFAPSPGVFVNHTENQGSVHAADVDGDGDQDLVTTGGVLHLHRNNGSGAYTETTATDLPPTAVVTSTLAVDDLDDDGDVDIAAIVQPDRTLLLINDGTGRFTDQSVRVDYFNAYGNRQLRAADYDDDGDLDLLTHAGDKPVAVNRVRQLVSEVLPRPGSSASFTLYSGPGFGAPALALLGVGFARATPPIAVPGLAGKLQLDPLLMQTIALVAAAPSGVTTVPVSVPPDNALFGLETWFQGAILPATGRPGFTNAVYEVVLR